MCGFQDTDPALQRLRNPSMPDANLITVSKSKSQRELGRATLIGGGTERESWNGFETDDCRTFSRAVVTKFSFIFRILWGISSTYWFVKNVNTYIEYKLMFNVTFYLIFCEWTPMPPDFNHSDYWRFEVWKKTLFFYNPV